MVCESESGRLRLQVSLCVCWPANYHLRVHRYTLSFTLCAPTNRSPRPICMLNHPTIPLQPTTKHVLLSSGVASPLPLQVRNSRLALLTTIRRCKGTSMPRIQVSPQLGKAIVKQLVVLGRLKFPPRQHRTKQRVGIGRV
jgi:hypothetical protein